MNPIFRHLFSFSIAALSVAQASAIADPSWLTPVDNENFGLAAERSGTQGAGGVLARVEFGYGVRSVAFFLGDTQIGLTYRTSASTTPGKVVFWDRLYFPTSGPRTLVAKGYDGFHATPIAIANGPTINLLTVAPIPTFTTLDAIQISPSFATLRGEVHTHGVDLIELYFEYGTTTAYGTKAVVTTSSQDVYPTERVSKQKKVSGLQPETEYHYRMVIKTAAGIFPGPDHTFTTAANQAPVTHPDVSVLKNDGTSVIYCASNDADDSIEDARQFTIVSVTNGAHGSVEFSEVGDPRVRYTADTTFTELDTFTYTVADQFGAESVGTVEVRSTAKHHEAIAGSYFALIGPSPNFFDGSISVQVLPTGAYTGSLTIHGIARSFSGAFSNDEDGGFSSSTGEEVYPRTGLEPTSFTFSISYSLYGIPEISGGSGGGAFYFDMEVSEQLIPPAEEVPEAGLFTMVLPNPDTSGSNAETEPQGNGFASVQVTKKGGRLSASGRTGDNQPFTAGGRMKRNRTIGISAASGVSRRARLAGSLGFNEQKGAGGALRWFNPERPKGAYANSFQMNIDARIERFIPPTGKNSIFIFRPGWFPVVEVVVQDREGEVVSTDKILVNRHKLDSGAGDPTRVRMSINPRTGVFSGTFKQTGLPAKKMMGIIQPQAGRGLGVAGAAGTDAPVEIIVP